MKKRSNIFEQILIFFERMAKTTNIVLTLKAKCAAIGTNITQVCKEAGVPRQTIERWKVEEPKTIKLLRQIEETIEKMAAKKQAEPA